MGMTHLSDWFHTLLGKISLFFVLSSFVLVFYYILGNFQGFLDSTQQMLLSLLEVSSLFGFIIEIYRIVLLFVLAVREKKAHIARLIRSFVFLFYFLGTYILIEFLASWL
jgi:hypothetical protein